MPHRIKKLALHWLEIGEIVLWKYEVTRHSFSVPSVIHRCMIRITKFLCGKTFYSSMSTGQNYILAFLEANHFCNKVLRRNITLKNFTFYAIVNHQILRNLNFMSKLKSYSIHNWSHLTWDSFLWIFLFCSPSWLNVQWGLFHFCKEVALFTI